MNEKSLIPSIRFAGFTDAWERCKLGDLGKARSGIGFPDAEQGGTEGLPFFKVSDMNISGNEHEMTKSQNYVSIEQIQRKKWTPILDVPAMFFTKVGAAVLLNRKRLCRTPFLLDNNTMAYSVCGEKWNVDFAKALFDTVNLPSLIQVGALPSYNAGDVESLEITLPNIEEQNQIGHFFRLLDRLITLHQRKYEKLLNIKKSMLDKMFPKNDELVPEVRFAGFTDAWERRKLGDLVESVPFKQYIASPEPDGKFEIIQQGSEPIIGYGNGIPCEDYAKITIFGDHTVSIYKPQKPFFVATDGTRLLTARVLDGDFFYFLLERYKPIPEGYKRHYTILIERYGCFPSHREQKLIAIFFRNIDHLITLHQRKLEKLQNIKKACLEKMFV